MTNYEIWQNRLTANYGEIVGKNTGYFGITMSEYQTTSDQEVVRRAFVYCGENLWLESLAEQLFERAEKVFHESDVEAFRVKVKELTGVEVTCHLPSGLTTYQSLLSEAIHYHFTEY